MKKKDISYVTVIGDDNIIVENKGNDEIFLARVGFLPKDDSRFEKYGMSQDGIVESVKALISHEIAFSAGRGWPPSEIIKFYREKGYINTKFLEIYWTSPDNYHVDYV